jgi:hypothetical protein
LTVSWITALIVTLAIVEGGWLAFDGGRALIVGDYVTPRSGEYAGQLGPWTKVVSAIGLEPRSTLVKCIHVVLGIGWLAAALYYASDPRGAWWAVLACAVVSLWHLPVGTLLSALEIGLLLLIRSRTG